MYSIKITDGTFDSARIPTLNQDTTGTAASAGNADTVDNLHASSFLRSDADDTVNAGVTYTWSATDTYGLKFVNASYSAYSLRVGGWTSSNDNNISRIRNSSGNLHLDSAADGNLYLNHYSITCQVFIMMLTVHSPQGVGAEPPKGP